MTAVQSPSLGASENMPKTAAEILMDPRLVKGPMSGEFNGREIELYADPKARELILFAISPQEATIQQFTDGFPLDFRITLHIDSGKLKLEQVDYHNETPSVKFEKKDFTAADVILMANDILANGVDFDEKDEVIIEALNLQEIDHQREIVKEQILQLIAKFKECPNKTAEIEERIRSYMTGLVNLDRRYDSEPRTVTDAVRARIGAEVFDRLLSKLIELNPQIRPIKK